MTCCVHEPKARQVQKAQCMRSCEDTSRWLAPPRSSHQRVLQVAFFATSGGPPPHRRQQNEPLNRPIHLNPRTHTPNLLTSPFPPPVTSALPGDAVDLATAAQTFMSTSTALHSLRVKPWKPIKHVVRVWRARCSLAMTGIGWDVQDCTNHKRP